MCLAHVTQGASKQDNEFASHQRTLPAQGRRQIEYKHNEDYVHMTNAMVRTSLVIVIIHTIALIWYSTKYSVIFVISTFLFNHSVVKSLSRSIFQTLTQVIVLIISCVIVAPVDGQWGRWAEWGLCDKDCGYGVQERKRECDEPKPRYGGRVCSGADTQKRMCNMIACPSGKTCLSNLFLDLVFPRYFCNQLMACAFFAIIVII